MQRVIIILGMHRSGTSCLAGILENAGVYFGEVSSYNLHNRKGNKENPRIMKLHNNLLKYNNGAWDSPPSGIEWPTELKTERDDIIREYKDASLWGFKDPRTLLLLDGWLETLQNVFIVASFRHPVSVAQSLSKRDHFAFEKSMGLWKIYNEKLLDYYEKYRFPLISFDLPVSSYKTKIEKLLQLLQLKPQKKTYEFYNDELRHHNDVSVFDTPPEIFAIYEKLTRIAL